MAKPVYTVDAGRIILCNGVRVATVFSKVQTEQKDGLYPSDADGLSPSDADDFAHYLCKLLNADAESMQTWWSFAEKPRMLDKA